MDLSSVQLIKLLLSAVHRNVRKKVQTFSIPNFYVKKKKECTVTNRNSYLAFMWSGWHHYVVYL